MLFLAFILVWPRSVKDVDSQRDVFVPRLRNKGVPEVHESVLGGCMLSIYLWTWAKFSPHFLANCGTILRYFCYLKEVWVLAANKISLFYESSYRFSTHRHRPIYADYPDIHGCFLLWPKTTLGCFHMHNCCCFDSDYILGYCRQQWINLNYWRQANATCRGRPRTSEVGLGRMEKAVWARIRFGLLCDERREWPFQWIC